MDSCPRHAGIGRTVHSGYAACKQVIAIRRINNYFADKRSIALRHLKSEACRIPGKATIRCFVNTEPVMCISFSAVQVKPETDVFKIANRNIHRVVRVGRIEHNITDARDRKIVGERCP
jgi:hypothetical protein